MRKSFRRLTIIGLTGLTLGMWFIGAIDTWVENSVWLSLPVPKALAQNFTSIPIDFNRLNAPGCTQLLPGATGQQIRILNGLLNISETGTGQTVSIIQLSGSTAATSGNYAACSAANGAPTNSALGSSGLMTTVIVTTGGGAAQVNIPINGNPAFITSPGNSLGIILSTNANVGGGLVILQQ